MSATTVVELAAKPDGSSLFHGAFGYKDVVAIWRGDSITIADVSFLLLLYWIISLIVILPSWCVCMVCSFVQCTSESIVGQINMNSLLKTTNKKSGKSISTSSSSVKIVSCDYCHDNK